VAGRDVAGSTDAGAAAGAGAELADAVVAVTGAQEGAVAVAAMATRTGKYRITFDIQRPRSERKISRVYRAHCAIVEADPHTDD